MTASNIVDLFFLFLFVTFSVRGAFKGLSGEVFSLLGSIGGVVLAWKFTKPVSAIILSRSSFSPGVVSVVVMVLLYILASVLAALMCKAVKVLIRFTQLSIIDRILGIGAGGLKTLVIIIFIYLISTSFSSLIPTEWISDSLTIKIGSSLWPAVEDFLIEANLLHSRFHISLP